MKNALVSGALIALLAITAAVWFTSRSDTDVPGVSTTDTPAPGPARDLPDLQAPEQPARVAAASVAVDPPGPGEDQANVPAGIDGVRARPTPAPADVDASGFINVTVLADPGDPVAGAVVSALDTAGGPGDQPRRRLSRTDSRGRARIRSLPMGSYQAIARADGFATGASERVRLTPTSPSATVVITLTHGGSVEGELLDVHGVPAAGARLSLHVDARAGEVGPLRQVRYTAVRDDGSFRIDLVPAGNYLLRTPSRGEILERVPRQQVELEVVDGQTTRVAFEDLRGTHVELTGLVLRDGAPLSGASILIASMDIRDATRLHSTRTDEEGRFEVALGRGGDYLFSVTDEAAGDMDMSHVETVPSERSHEVVLSFWTGSIAGHVYDAHQRPLPEVPLLALGAQEGDVRGHASARATTDANGAYEFRSLVGTTYRVLAGSAARISGDYSESTVNRHAGGARVADVHVGPGDHVTGIDLHLSTAAAVTGVVTDREHDPVAFARVECFPDLPAAEQRARRIRIHHVQVPYVESSRSGRFELGGLEPGAYRLRAIFEHEISPWAEWHAEGEATGEVKLVLDRGTMLTIEVSAAGQPVDGRFVNLVDETELVVASGSLKDGIARLGPLLPGTYTAMIHRQEGELNATQSVKLDEESEQTVRVALP